MASIISAGTTSGTSLNLSGDTSGVLQLASNGSTTAVTIDTSQRVGIGTASPTNTLQVAGGISATSSAPAFQASAAIMDVSAGVARFNATGADNSTNGVMTFNTANANASGFNERMRIPAAGGVQVVTCVSVGNATPSASGAGITFPATQSASSDANTLDDYEEGTFTPTIVGRTTAGTATYNIQQARYTKIGNMVTAHVYIDWSSGTGTGGLDIGGLPFTSGSTSIYSFAIGGMAALNVAQVAGTYLVARVLSNATRIQIQSVTQASGEDGGAPYDALGTLVVGGTYMI
jgi:hypothetical protein